MLTQFLPLSDLWVLLIHTVNFPYKSKKSSRKRFSWPESEYYADFLSRDFARSLPENLYVMNVSPLEAFKSVSIIQGYGFTEKGDWCMLH